MAFRTCSTFCSSVTSFSFHVAPVIFRALRGNTKNLDLTPEARYAYMHCLCFEGYLFSMAYAPVETSRQRNPRPRDVAISRLIRQFGAANIGRALGISQSAVSQWKRVPLGQALPLALAFSLQPHEIRPDLWDGATTMDEMVDYLLVRDRATRAQVLPESLPPDADVLRLQAWEALNRALDRLLETESATTRETASYNEPRPKMRKILRVRHQSFRGATSESPRHG
jgi:DNA-binding transcriptional regulator YdaS (Cro superfamily)